MEEKKKQISGAKDSDEINSWEIANILTTQTFHTFSHDTRTASRVSTTISQPLGLFITDTEYREPREMGERGASGHMTHTGAEETGG